MCGIAVILRFTPGPVAPGPVPGAWLSAVDAGIAHRGPDGSGVLSDRVRTGGGWLDAVLIHRRLSIIDHAGGAQPMADPPRAFAPGGAPPRGSLAVVFNGCVYNHRDLRAALTRAGAEFSTDHSDTEVLPHGWRAWNRGVFSRLDALFACAIWDRDAASLITARDAFGEKPLHTGSAEIDGASVVVVSSTESAWCRWLAAVGREPVLHQGLRMHIAQHPTVAPPWESRTQLPGTWRSIGVRDGTLTLSPPARFAERTAGRVPTPPDSDATADADTLVARSVAGRLDADVPLACLLSGGVDSSLVTAHAARLVPGLRTFCVRMPDSRYDESPFARAVAEHLGTRHTTLDCDPAPIDDLARLIAQIGLPFTDSSLLPTHWAARAIAPHAKVALSGDGGDELFGGYERYITALLPADLRAAAAELPAELLDRAHPKSRRAKAARLARACAGRGYTDLVSVFPSEIADRVFGPGAPSPARWPEDPMAEDLGDAGIFAGDLLRKVDSASMAAGVEVRAPLLGRELADWATHLPIGTLMPPRAGAFGLGRRLKAVLRGALGRHLPADFINRPKSGFAVPIGEWIRDDFGGLGTAVADVMASTDPWPRTHRVIGIDRSACRGLLDEHLTGRRDHGQRLYTLLVLHLWERWLTGLRSS